MTRAYQTQSIFFAFGVLCTLTIYNGDNINAMNTAKARVSEIDKSTCSNEPVVIGYAAQEVKKIFAREGVTEATIKLGDMIINMGGMRRIGVRDPFSTDERNFAFLDVGEKSIMTICRNGLKNTVFSRSSNLQCITLIGSDAVQLSKLCCTLLGYTLSEALTLLNDSEFDAIFITKDEQVFTTSGLYREQQIAA